MQDIKNLVSVSKDDIINLKNNYINALKDKKFKTLISTLDTTEDILIKYTSNLEEASVEFDNCLNCSGLEHCLNKIKGFMYTPIVNERTISFDYLACKYKRKEINDNKYLDNIELFQMSKSLKNVSIKDIHTSKERMEIIKFFKDFLDNYGKNKVKGVYLNGNFGTGKTFLISCLFNELARRNVKCAIVYYPEFLRSLKESFDTDYKDKFNYIRKVPVLLLDDIGAEVVTGWSRDEILGSILQYRMENDLPVFFTSNLSMDELEEHLSVSNTGIDKVKARRIIERIKFITNDIKLISVNRRKND